MSADAALTEVLDCCSTVARSYCEQHFLTSGVAALRRCCSPVSMASGEPVPLICCMTDLLNYWREVVPHAACGCEPQGRDGQDHERDSSGDEPECTRPDIAG